MDRFAKTFRASVLFTGFLAWTFTLIPVQWVAVKTGLRVRKRIPILYHSGVCRLLGIRVETRGARHEEGPVLFAANHMSYLDIVILGSLYPISFVAKQEVAGWPLFGTLAKLQETVFVDRERRTRAAEQRNDIHRRLETGDSLVLFPEGTSSDGNRVLTFKSALMSVAQLAIVSGPEDLEETVTVQPLSIAYTHLHGVPMGRQYRPYFAWYGDMELFPHLWEAFSLGPFDVTVEYHPAVTIQDMGNRKALAAYCQKACGKGVSDAITGRPAAEPPVLPEAGLEEKEAAARRSAAA